LANEFQGNQELAAVVRAQFGDSPLADTLFAQILEPDRAIPRYLNERHLNELIRIARDRSVDWEVRCASVLILEHRILQELGDRPITDDDCRRVLAPLNPSIALLAELRDRLRRLNRIHRGIRGRETTPRSLLDFILVSRQECKLTLARYLWDPVEVAERILSLVRVTSGRRMDQDPDHILDTSRIAYFDRRLLTHLRGQSRVLWVRSKTPAGLNSTVEYPLGTVALVIKPPGSDQEFEIKRVGFRGPTAMDIIYRRDGVPVPPSHRLQGLSCGHMLENEALAGRRFAEIYTAVHGVAPPASRVVDLTEITEVPTERGAQELLLYLNDEGVYGPGFAEMRERMRQATEEFDRTVRSPDLPGRLGWTVRFLFHTAPRQAWIVGTSSFRLDRTACYLSALGPQAYFREGLGKEFDGDDSRRFADELLEEVLGVFIPPEQFPENYEDYLAAVFAMPANRAAADAAYMGCLQDLGKYWGTLLGCGGYSDGESFVSRNVGLKSRWTNGAWRVRICFMDHDCMVLPMPYTKAFEPARALLGMCRDEGHLLGSTEGRKPCPGAIGHLNEIYRVSADTRREGMAVFRRELAAAFGETRFEIGKMTSPTFIGGLFAWDRVAQIYLSSPKTEPPETWKAEVSAYLITTGCTDRIKDEFIATVEKYSSFIDKFHFLYESRYRDLSLSYRQPAG
jgi:hypothetical protein